VRDDEPAVLSELLDEELGSDPTTARRLTNHLPMALVAKAHLGADDDELRRFATIYARRNVPLASVQHDLDERTWTSAIGQRGASGDLREYFLRRINDSGVDETLRSHLPILLPGISGAAFHGAIRLAYALEVRSTNRIAAGLGYLAEVATPLGPLVMVTPTSDSPLALLHDYVASHPRPLLEHGRNIGEQMHAVALEPDFQSLASTLELNEHTEQKLADAALQIFATTGDFTALHGVTGTAAISALRPWIAEPFHVDLFAFQALAAAYLTIGAPELWSRDRTDAFVAANPTSPAQTELVGANSDDEHVSKLIYTSHRYFAQTAEPLYLAVAARKAGLLASSDF
jgi:Questin oxidase-like